MLPGYVDVVVPTLLPDFGRSLAPILVGLGTAGLVGIVVVVLLAARSNLALPVRPVVVQGDQGGTR